MVDLIDKENWSATGVDIKGDAYEELLAKGAEDVKSGAGQYFTPHALISAMVDCVQPTAADTVADPACGTGGFLLRGLPPRDRRPADAGRPGAAADRLRARHRAGRRRPPGWPR